MKERIYSFVLAVTVCVLCAAGGYAMARQWAYDESWDGPEGAESEAESTLAGAVIEAVLTENRPTPAETVEAEREEKTALGRFKVTGYVPGCAHCCGKTDGIMANGEVCIPGKHCATGDNIPFGEELMVEGVGMFTVADRGVPNGVIDIACNTHEECYEITGEYEVFSGGEYK